MRHALITVNEQRARVMLSRMANNGFFKDLHRTDRNYFVRTLSGREDVITIISNESQTRGVRFNGRILRQDNSSSIDDLFYFVKSYNRMVKGEYDAETSRWHWAEEDAYSDFASHDRPLLRTIADGLENEIWSR